MHPYCLSELDRHTKNSLKYIKKGYLVHDTKFIDSKINQMEYNIKLNILCNRQPKKFNMPWYQLN